MYDDGDELILSGGGDIGYGTSLLFTIGVVPPTQSPTLLPSPGPTLSPTFKTTPFSTLKQASPTIPSPSPTQRTESTVAMPNSRPSKPTESASNSMTEEPTFIPTAPPTGGSHVEHKPTASPSEYQSDFASSAPTHAPVDASSDSVIIRVEITILATPNDVSLRVIGPGGKDQAHYEIGSFKETGTIHHYALVSAGQLTVEFGNESGEGNGTWISN